MLLPYFRVRMRVREGGAGARYSVATDRFRVPGVGPGSGRRSQCNLNAGKAFGSRRFQVLGTRWRLGARLPPRRAIPCAMPVNIRACGYLSPISPPFHARMGAPPPPPPREIREKNALVCETRATAVARGMARWKGRVALVTAFATHDYCSWPPSLSALTRLRLVAG